MSLSVNTDAVNAVVEVNESPLGKRKPDLSSSDRNPKRSPLANVENAANSGGIVRAEKVAATPMKRYSFGAHSTPYSANKFKVRVSKEEVQATNDGRASVHKLSEWLACESAKKEKPKRIVPCAANATPVRFRMKPKINKEDVEATDDKRVSVKTLSQWISDDPFEQKKLRHVRSGAKVIAKSRVFEMEKVTATSRQVDIKEGSVHERQAWLNEAFRHNEEEDGRPKPPLPKDRATQPRSYQIKKVNESPEKTLKSVHEKKEWLNNAFKGKVNTPSIMKCPSADDACCPRQNYQTISQQASCDGMSTPYKEKEAPVRLYLNARQTKEDSPEKTLKSVHDKQAWLTNAFKKQDDGKASQMAAPRLYTKNTPAKVTNEPAGKLRQESITTSSKESAGTDDSRSSSDEPNDAMETNDAIVDNEGHMCVSDRAKWLRRAFK